jgi:uncharacterized membrane protein
VLQLLPGLCACGHSVEAVEVQITNTVETCGHLLGLVVGLVLGVVVGVQLLLLLLLVYIQRHLGTYLRSNTKHTLRSTS